MNGQRPDGEIKRINAGDLRRAAKIATLEHHGRLSARILSRLHRVEKRATELGDAQAVTLLRPRSPRSRGQRRRARESLARAVHRLDKRLDRALARHNLAGSVDQMQRRFERSVAARGGERAGQHLRHTLSWVPHV